MQCNVSNFFFNLFPRWKLDLNDLLNSISDMDYILIKTEVPYIKKGFPTNYPIGKDLDIVVTKNRFQEIANKAILFSSKYNYFHKKIIYTNNNLKIRFNLLGQLHYQIDISHSLDYIDNMFI
jgi:Zn-dependent protease